MLGNVDEADVQRFNAGIQLDDGYETLPAELTILGQEETEEGTISSISLIIHEGKFHQVKRMFQAVGKRVVYLKRVAMGELELASDLAIGSYRELTADELSLLQVLEQEISRRSLELKPNIPQRRSPTRGRIYEEKMKAMDQSKS